MCHAATRPETARSPRFQPFALRRLVVPDLERDAFRADAKLVHLLPDLRLMAAHECQTLPDRPLAAFRQLHVAADLGERQPGLLEAGKAAGVR